MNKPKTIADLKINWNFNFETYLDYRKFEEHFRNRNPDLKDYDIVNNTYLFHVITDNVQINHFSIRTMDITFNKYSSLFELMFQIDFDISIKLFPKPSDYSYELVKFVRISDIEYNVILRKVEKCRF